MFEIDEIEEDLGILELSELDVMLELDEIRSTSAMKVEEVEMSKMQDLHEEVEEPTPNNVNSNEEFQGQILCLLIDEKTKTYRKFLITNRVGFIYCEPVDIEWGA